MNASSAHSTAAPAPPCAGHPTPTGHGLRHGRLGHAAWLACILTGLATACTDAPHDVARLDAVAPIVPDYADVTLPTGLALPTFALADTAARRYDRVEIRLDERSDTALRWSVTARRRDDHRWVAYRPVVAHIATDSIDPYIAYRRIEPGYRIWHEMGLYQRQLATYDETPILTNSQTGGGCMNCHTFCGHDPRRMVFHLRGAHGGTYLALPHGAEVAVRRAATMPDASGIGALARFKSLVYPAWHPAGRYVAFSANTTQQAFHSSGPNRIEVFDFASAVLVYDTETDSLVTSPLLMQASQYVTFPTFAPDGRWLYYCTADTAAMPEGYRDVHYSLCRLAFDATTAAFGTQADTLWDAHVHGGSIALPRISPDGRWLLCTHAAYGTFHIWHRDADLWLFDLAAIDPALATAPARQATGDAVGHREDATRQAPAHGRGNQTASGQTSNYGRGKRTASGQTSNYGRGKRTNSGQEVPCKASHGNALLRTSDDILAHRTNSGQDGYGSAHRMSAKREALVPIVAIALNSAETESFHSWSSSGRWVVFSSRRLDGLYTRPYIAHFNPADGTFSKPFALPQPDADFYQRMLQSYNLPEFVKGPVELPTDLIDN